MHRIGLIVIVFGVLLLGTSGCSRSIDPEIPPLVPVKGKLTVNGKPAGGIGIVFVPDGSQREGIGLTDASGNFEMKHRGTVPGMEPGEYRIVLDNSNADGTGTFLPARYSNGGILLRITVPKDGIPELVLDASGK